jgi:hypothetical protein
MVFMPVAGTAIAFGLLLVASLLVCVAVPRARAALFRGLRDPKAVGTAMVGLGAGGLSLASMAWDTEAPPRSLWFYLAFWVGSMLPLAAVFAAALVWIKRRYPADYQALHSDSSSLGQLSRPALTVFLGSLLVGLIPGGIAYAIWFG